MLRYNYYHKFFNRYLFKLSLFLILILSGNTIGQVTEGTLYGSTASFGQLITIDTTTATGTLVDTINGFLAGVTEIEFRQDGVLFASTGGGESTILKVDPCSGVSTFIGEHQFGAVNGMEFIDGILYGTFVTHSQDSSRLVTINQETGELTIIGYTGFNTISGLAFDEDSTLFGVTSGSDTSYLVTINTMTGEATLIGSTGFKGLESLEFGPSGTLYAGTGMHDSLTIGSLITLDTSTGMGTLVGSTGFNTISGLSFVPSAWEGSHADINPDSIGFGSVEVGESSKSEMVTIRNLGSENLTVSNISVSEPSFALSNLPDFPATITPGYCESFNVSFAPLDTGAFNSFITIASNDQDDPSFNIQLTALGYTLTNADSGMLYASTGNNDGGRLLQINPETGQGTLIGPTGLDAVPGLAINLKGEIYGSDGDGDIYRIDAATGLAIYISSTDLNNLAAIAFDSNDILYGLEKDEGYLYIIDPLTGNSTEIGYSGYINGISFNPTDGSLWAVQYSSIYTIDIFTGSKTYIGNTGFSSLTDLHFDAAGNLFATIGNQLVLLDKTSGSASIIGDIGYYNVRGLAFYNVQKPGKHIRIIPKHVEFGKVDVNEDTGRQVIISNPGSKVLEINNVVLPDSPFTINDFPQLPSEVAAGEDLTINITFAPKSAGTFIDTLVINSDDPERPAVYITFNGNGFAEFPLVVNSTADGSDTDVTDGVCDAGSGDCTLRAAIEEANHRAGTDTISFNIEGPGPHTIQPNSALPLIFSPVVIDGTTEPDFSGTPVVEIDGSNAEGANGLWVYSGGSTIRGLVINRFADEAGIHLGNGDNNVIEGNYIGTDVTGTTAMGNGIGIWLLNNSANNTIGGTSGGTSNLISGNLLEGINVDDGATNNLIIGNLIGTDITGTGAIPNEAAGVALVTSENVIGGISEAARNIISGNGQSGIDLIGDAATQNGIYGNYIGTDITGKKSISNGSSGIWIEGASNNTIGGSDYGAGNLISGNRENGIHIYGGEQPVSNIVIQGNFIGTESDGQSYSANGADGIKVEGEDNNSVFDILIGGEDSTYANTIAFNRFRGIFVESGSNVSILSNSIFGNSLAGIRLLQNSAIANDNLDADEGPNKLQNYPEFGGVYINDNDDIFVEYKVTSQPGNSTYPIRVQFFKADDKGQGKTLIGEDYYTESDYASGFKSTGLTALSSALNEGDNVVAIATDAEGNSSAFSSEQTVGILTGLELQSQLPVTYSLKQNYPNPFNPSTTIRYDLPNAGKVEIKIFDSLGNEVVTLVNKQQAAGRYSVVWDASGVSSGVYFYRIKSGKFTALKKCMLIK